LRFGRRFDISSALELRLAPEAHVVFGNDCVVDRGMTLLCEGTLTVGNGTVFGHHCTVGACERIDIGENCLIAEMVSIRDHDHRFDRLDIPILKQGSVSSPISIGNNVWLAGKVTVLRGVTIGDNAVIGANSVVTHDIPANAVAVGAPARIIRFRIALARDTEAVATHEEKTVRSTKE